MKLLFSFLITSALASLAFSAEGAGSEPCGPFRVHLSAELPPEPKKTRSPLPTETDLLISISSLKGQSEFRDVYKKWIASREEVPTDHERRRLLACIYHYSRMDTDQDGTLDWTSIVDGKLSLTLYPNDDDLDNDGIPNVLDPEPLKPNSPAVGTHAVESVPPHLKMSGGRGKIQAALFRRHDIVAIDHTDRHSAAVLKELLTILDHGFPKGFAKRLTRLKYLYASRGHDPEVDIAGYHYMARAITIGGEDSYSGTKLLSKERMTVASALVHEIGHVYFLSEVHTDEAISLATSTGGWGMVLNGRTPTTLFDPAFFARHPYLRGETSLAPLFPTRYAMTNIHEWFADCFAAFMLDRLSRTHQFSGASWTIEMKKVISPSWIGPSSQSKAFFSWLSEKLSRAEQPASPIIAPPAETNLPHSR